MISIPTEKDLMDLWKLINKLEEKVKTLRKNVDDIQDKLKEKK